MAMINADHAVSFVIDHGTVVATALRSYAEHMKAAAEEALTAYEAIKNDPDKIAAQDQSLITTHGLRQAAGVFDDAAQTARAALSAVNALDEDLPA